MEKSSKQSENIKVKNKNSEVKEKTSSKPKERSSTAASADNTKKAPDIKTVKNRRDVKVVKHDKGLIHETTKKPEDIKTSDTSLKKRIEQLEKQIDHLKDDNISLQKEVDEVDKLIADIDKKLQRLDGEEVIVDDDYLRDEIRDQRDQLLDKRESLIKKKSGITEAISKNNAELVNSTDDLTVVKEELSAEKVKGGSFVGNAVKGAVKAPLSFGTKTVKDVASKVNPLDQKIDRNDISDTGAESLRLANSSIKKGVNSIKTVKNTVKTTQNTIRTTKDVAKGTAKAAYKTVAVTKEVVVTTAKVTGTVFTHIAAVALNPVVLTIIVLLFVIVMTISPFIVIISGTVGGSATGKYQMASGKGLGDVAEAYHQGEEYFNSSVSYYRDGYTQIIDELYYDSVDKVQSDLIFIERYMPNGEEPDQRWCATMEVPDDQGGMTTLIWGEFAEESWKDQLKGEVFAMQLEYVEAAAIAYVYLEKEAAGGTVNGIHDVSYSQDVFDTVVAESVSIEDVVEEDQPCIDGHCAYEEGDSDWHCEHKHTMHSVTVRFYDKYHVMDALNFSDQEKQWALLTEQGFINNLGLE